MTPKQRKLFATMVEWSKEVGLDYRQLIRPDGGICFVTWFEKIIQRMTLEDVEIYISTPDMPGVRDTPLVRKLSEMARAHRERLLQKSGKGVGLIHAKSERAAG